MRKLHGLLIAVAIGALLTGCTQPAPNPTTGSGSAAVAPTLYMEGPATIVQNYNPFGPGDKGPGLTYIYDALVRIDHQHPEAPIKPWLAESWAFNADGTQLTVHLRNDVTFSDGTPLTAADVVYTLSVPLNHPELNAWGGSYTSVVAPDDHTVVLTYPTTAYGQLATLANAPIVQKAQWASQDVTTFTNPAPVGSGLLTLDKIMPTAATFNVRTDWWRGQSAVQRVEMVAYAADTFKLQLQRNELQWSGAAWPTAQQEYVSADPKNHQAVIVAHGGAESLMFNSNKAPFNDVHARRAIADSIDIARLSEISGLPAPSPCGFTASRYADSVLIPACQGGAIRKVDAAAAKAELAAGGWTVEGGNLVKDGQSITVAFAYPVSWTSAEPIYRDIKTQLSENLGLNITLLTPPGDQYDAAVEEAHAALRFTAGAAGMLDAFRWMGNANNMGGWDDARTTSLVAQMSATNPADPQYVALGLQLQQIVYDDVPYIPTVSGNWSILINSTSWTGWPTDPSTADYLATPYVAPSAEVIMLGLKPTGK